MRGSRAKAPVCVRARETKGVEWLRGCWLLPLLNDEEEDEEEVEGPGGWRWEEDAVGTAGGVKRGSRGPRSRGSLFLCLPRL